MRVTGRSGVFIGLLAVIAAGAAGTATAQVPGPPLQLGPPQSGPPPLVTPQRLPRPEPVTPQSGVPILRMERPFTPQPAIRPIPRRQTFPAPGNSASAGASASRSHPLMPGAGFTMTVPVQMETPGGQGDAINLPREVPAQLRKCWSPPPAAQRQEITIRIAFNRDGSAIGAPRITYVSRDLPEARKVELRRSLLDAVAACLPLRFTPGLASAIAGRPFAIRYIVPAAGEAI